MTTVAPDILSASIVFAGAELLNKSGASESLANAVNAGIVTEEVGIPLPSGAGAPPSVRRYTLQRDRISVEAFPGRTSIQRDFPSNPPSDDFARLAQVTESVLSNTDFTQQGVNAHGYNMIMEFDPGWNRPTIEYLGEHMFSPSPFSRDDWKHTGGYGSLVFEDNSGHRWTFLMEPRPRDNAESRKLYLKVNLHVPEPGLPELDSIESALNESLKRSVYLVEQLLLAGA